MVNPNISYGTCYWAQHSETEGDFIPCGNVNVGNWPCCAPGDVCLGFEGANACYDASTGNTYVAGCSDEDYVDKTCFQKLAFSDQEWVAVQHCNEESNGNWDWGGCRNDPVNDTTLTKLSNDVCDDYCSTTLWVGASSISAYATLPVSAGGSITYVNGFNPTSTSRSPGSIPSKTTTSPTASATSSASSNTGTATTSASGTPTPTTHPNGLSTGAKAGIGVGSVAAAALIAAVVVLSLMLLRRRKKKQTVDASTPLPPYPGDKPTAGPPNWGPGNAEDDRTMHQSGFKYELPADNHVSSAVPSPVPAAAAAAAAAAVVRPSPNTASPDHSTAGSEFYVSPQSTGTGLGYQEGNNNGHQGSISELHG